MAFLLTLLLMCPATTPGSLSVTTASAGGSGDEAPTSQEFLQWVDENALPLEDWNTPQGEELLGSLSVGKRFFFIGELDHFVRINFQARLPLIRFLHERGWRNLGMERGISDGRRMDEYLGSGDLADLDRVRMFGRYQRQNPSHAGDAYRHFHREYQFAADLLSLGRDEDRIHYFGYDLDMAVGGAFEDMQQRLASHAGIPVVSDFLASLQEIAGLPRAQQLEVLGSATDELRDPESDLSKELPAALIQSLQRDVAWHQAALEFLKPRPQTVEIYQERENWMFRAMDERVQNSPAGERFILKGHGAHLSKDSSAFAMPVSRMWRSLGTHIEQKFPGEVCSIWIMYDHG